MPPTRDRGVVRFAVFELDSRTGTLRKNGVRLKVQEQPLRVLSALLARPGELVTREELREILWPDDTFVDFDNNLNTAINKLREVLGDSAGSPRFVETVPKRGYRFLAPVDGLPTEPPREPVEVVRGPNWIPYIALAVVSVLLVLAVTALMRRQEPPVQSPLRKFRLQVPEGTTDPAISPNGKHVAYVTGTGKEADLWVHDLDQLEPRMLEGGAGASLPFWSPDSRFIGFAAGGELRKVALSGGQAVAICALPSGNEYAGGTWSPDGSTIAFSRIPNIYQVPARGGVARIIEEAKPGGAIDHFEAPNYASTDGGLRLLLTWKLRSGVAHYTGTRSPETGELAEFPSELLLSPVFAPTGHVIGLGVLGGSGVMWAVPVSTKTLEATGVPFPVASGCAQPSVSADGTLACLENPEVIQPLQLVWRDRRGTALSTVGEPNLKLCGAWLSRDGRQLVVRDIGRPSLLVYDSAMGLDRRHPLPVSFSGPFIWSRTDDSVAFHGWHDGNFDIFRLEVTGSGEIEPLVSTPSDEIPLDWSADGGTLLYIEQSADGWRMKAMTGDKQETLGVCHSAGPLVESFATLSPDGQVLAYVSNESGKREVYVQGFPDGRGKQRVSRGRGDSPRWSPHGRELFYVGDGFPMAVPITTTPEISVGTPAPLFRQPILPFSPIVVSPEGERFLLAEPTAPAGPPAIRVVQNWYEEFRDASQR